MITLAGQGHWGQILNDDLSTEEKKEEDHILEEGVEAEQKHLNKDTVNKEIFNQDPWQ
tara:strand:- start:934 stop:1107 length:174 start_codon:yes stop_codon:yes gene_type:complete